ncbi:MAG: regulator [Flavobacteriaceae bacterium]|nr:regulator [Flavobacteriaceae bacterium]|tara:strand:- start:1444 stop:2859 length:1416 start_codon:yes stop_codon:yes gene_type:complete
MKTFFAIIAFVVFFNLSAQIPCENGFAGSFPCDNYDLISQVPLSVMNSVKANDSWGWTDPIDGKEYAIICLNEATAFIDISDPLNPLYLGQLPGNSPDHMTWRDAKTYNNYVFIVSEDSNHGMQVFDLTRLRNVTNPPEIFSADALYSGFGSSHNIAINEETGFAYVIGSSTFQGGAHFIDISDPINPIGVGGYENDGYTHDAQIVIYNGPDTDYQGQEIMFASNETEVAIVDVTNKSNPITIATIDYTNVSYTHQGWLTENQRYFLLGDETDEIDFGNNSRTMIFDFQDLDNPQFHFDFFWPTPATDHNGYVKGNKFYLANNAAGLRVLDISDIDNSNVALDGYFDSYPSNDAAGFNGSWNVYPYFESGHIVISDRAEGFLLVKPSVVLDLNDEFIEKFSVLPNPVSNNLYVKAFDNKIQSIEIFDLTGKTVYSNYFNDSLIEQIEIEALNSGFYFDNVNATQIFKIIKK